MSDPGSSEPSSAIVPASESDIEAVSPAVRRTRSDSSSGESTVTASLVDNPNQQRQSGGAGEGRIFPTPEHLKELIGHFYNMSPYTLLIGVVIHILLNEQYITSVCLIVSALLLQIGIMIRTKKVELPQGNASTIIMYIFVFLFSSLMYANLPHDSNFPLGLIVLIGLVSSIYVIRDITDLKSAVATAEKNFVDAARAVAADMGEEIVSGFDGDPDPVVAGTGTPPITFGKALAFQGGMIVIASLLGFIVSLIANTIKENMFKPNKSGSTVRCSRPATQAFKCTVYKNGKPVEDVSITD